jgi:hypothetical protein
MQMLFMARHPAFGFEWATTHRKADGGIEEDLLMISVGTGWWRPKVNDQILELTSMFRFAPEAGRAILTLQTMIHDSQLNALQWLQSMSRHPERKEKRWTIDGEVDQLLVEGGAPFLATNEPLLRFRRLDVRLEDHALESLFGHSVEKEAKALGISPKLDDTMRKRLIEAGKAWEQSPATMRMRELSEFDRDALRLLFEIGARYAEGAVDDDDFPSEFDPAYSDDRADSVSVVEPPPTKKKGLFGFR